MDAAWKFAKVTGQAVCVFGCVVAALAAMIWMLRIALPDELTDNLRQRIYAKLGANDFASSRQKDSDELVSARIDAGAVENWSMRCRSLLKRASAVQRTSAEARSVADTRDQALSDTHPLNLHVNALSESIFVKRVQLDRKLNGTYALAQVGALVSILIGMLTTIAVGLSSTEWGKQQTRLGLSLRVLALVLPAMGTAVAAMVAFYDPSGSLARQSQAAAGLQQLHRQIALQVWKLPCPKGVAEPVAQDVAAKMDAWAQREQELGSLLGGVRAESGTPQNKSGGPNAAGGGAGR